MQPNNLYPKGLFSLKRLYYDKTHKREIFLLVRQMFFQVNHQFKIIFGKVFLIHVIRVGGH